MLTGELPFRHSCQNAPGPKRLSDGSWTREHVLRLMQDDKPWPEAGRVTVALAAAAEGAAAADGRAGAGVAYERELCALLRGMLRFDPRFRWGLEQVRANVWFRGRLGEEALEAALRGRELPQPQEGGAGGGGGGGEVVGGTCLEVQERVRSACDAFRREVGSERGQQQSQALQEERRRLEGRLRHLDYERELLQRDEAHVRQHLLWLQQTEQALQQTWEHEQQGQVQQQDAGQALQQVQEQEQQQPLANADISMSPSASPSKDEGEGEEEAGRKGEQAQEQGLQPLQEEVREPQGQQHGKAEEQGEPRDQAAPEQERPQKQQEGEQPAEQGGEQQGGKPPEDQQR